MKKTCLITGASRGIGYATAKILAKEGYNIVINYNTSEDKALALQEELKNMGAETLLVKCDISNENQVKEMVTAILKKFGKIDFLCNNAGIAIDTLFQDKTVENFKKILDTNLIGTFLVSKYVGEIM